ncbi:MAG: M28 family peptidase [Lyngbya sp.]|nr:M28 family peptidase [Lyngbya sp.]
MIKKRIFALFLMAGFLIGIWNWKTNSSNLLFPREFTSVFSKTAEVEVNLEPRKAPVLSEVKVSNSQPNEKIDPEQIWSHLENLVGERYTENYREFTRNYLIKQLKQFGLTPSLQTFEQGVNIVAKTPGNDPEAATLLIGAHYDTVLNSPGADDNASGMAVVLEVARLFGSKPTANALEIVFFDQEEPGLLGSLAFTSLPENIQNLRHVIVLDMVGYACRVEGCQQYPSGLNVASLLQANGVTSPDKGEFLVIVGEAQHRDLLASFQGISSGLSNRKLPPVVPLPIPLKGVLTPDVLRSDHAPFWYQNIPAVLVTDTANLRSPHYHQPTDTLANLDREFLMGSAQVIVNVVTRLLEN